MSRYSETHQPLGQERRWTSWAAIVVVACAVLVVLLLAAYVLRGSDTSNPSGADLTPCGDGVESLAALVPEDGVPGENLGTIRSAAVAASRHCETSGIPTYCRTAARAAWNLADAARTEARRAQALANFRRTQPRCLQELAELQGTADEQADIQQPDAPQARAEAGGSNSWSPA